MNDNEMNEKVSEIMDGDPFFERLTQNDYFNTRKKLEVALRTAYRGGYRRAQADEEALMLEKYRAERRGLG